MESNQECYIASSIVTQSEKFNQCSYFISFEKDLTKIAQTRNMKALFFFFVSFYRSKIFIHLQENGNDKG